MKFEIIYDDKTPIERRITVRVDSDSVEKVWREEVGKIGREVGVPGFRKGKAPARVVEGHVGRAAIWERVRDEVSRQVTNEIIRDADPAPLAPPTIEYGDSNDENTIESSKIWKPGDVLEVVITYLFPPPTPEDIERNLIKGIGAEIPDPLKPVIEGATPPGTNPPDPRAQIPGSGLDTDN